jgi:hypothetical protein
MSSFQIALALSAGAVLTPELSQPVNSGVSLIQTVDGRTGIIETTVGGSEESIAIQKLKAELEQLRKENEKLKKQGDTAPGSAKKHAEMMAKRQAAVFGNAGGGNPLLDGIRKAGGAPPGGGNPLLAGIQKAGGKPPGNPMSMNMAAIRNGISKNNEAAGASPKSMNMIQEMQAKQRAKQKLGKPKLSIEERLAKQRAEKAEKEGKVVPSWARKNKGDQLTFQSNNMKDLGTKVQQKKKEDLPKKTFPVPVEKKTSLEELKEKANKKGKKEVLVNLAYFDEFLRSVDNLTWNFSKSDVKTAFMNFVKKVNNDRLN